MTRASENRLKRSVKAYFVLIPVTLFCVSFSFGLVHHFFRYSWAGDIFYYTALLFVTAVVLEIFIILFTK